jgi:Flp pilus assembly pilin Flp
MEPLKRSVTAFLLFQGRYPLRTIYHQDKLRLQKVFPMFSALLNDEAGFIVSAELVLIATIVVIGLIVGLSEIQHAVVSELNDVADAVGSLNQSYYFSGFNKAKSFGAGTAAYTRGSIFVDQTDDCDNNQCALSCDAPVVEGPKL